MTQLFSSYNSTLATIITIGSSNYKKIVCSTTRRKHTGRMVNSEVLSNSLIVLWAGSYKLFDRGHYFQEGIICKNLGVKENKKGKTQI